MTTLLNSEQSLPTHFTATEEMEAAFSYKPTVCEDSLQFLCMRWTTGSPECRGQVRCELQEAAK